MLLSLSIACFTRFIQVLPPSGFVSENCPWIFSSLTIIFLLGFRALPGLPGHHFEVEIGGYIWLDDEEI
jgi:hypothetical protein